MSTSLNNTVTSLERQKGQRDPKEQIQFMCFTCQSLLSPEDFEIVLALEESIGKETELEFSYWITQKT